MRVSHSLFVPQGGHRLQPGGVQRGIEPAHQAQDDREDHRADGQSGRDQEEVQVRGSEGLLATVAAIQPRNSPVSPPMRPMTPASLRNCRTIWPSEAPMALRTPISRVRSLTDMVMVLITESPPTNSEMMATP